MASLLVYCRLSLLGANCPLSRTSTLSWLETSKESDDFENLDNTIQNANLDLANFLDLHIAMEPPTENNSIAENVQ